MEFVRLELLGPPDVLRDGRVVAGVGRKALGLLAFLAAPKGRFHNRDELAALLWSDRFDDQARQSLRQTLSTLRKSIGEAIITSEQGVAFAPDAIASDVEEFEALVVSGDLADLRRACALYRGEFLEGVQRSSPAFDEWIENRRRALRNLFLDALETVARRELGEGAADEALSAARRLAGEEPAHEGAHRIIMQILAQQGHRAAALRQFEACKAALRRLDAEPEAETVNLAERIRAAPGPEGPAADAAPPADESMLPPSLRRFFLPGIAALIALSVFAIFVANRPPPAAQSRGEQRAQCAAAANLPAFVTPAIVVLPLEADGNGAAVEFADTITDRISDTFAAVPRLSVVTGPPRGHADLRRSPRELASALGVTHVLNGAVRVDGDRASVSVRLIEGASGEVLWSTLQSYDLSSADRLAARDQIALEVVRAAQRELTDGEQALHFPQTSSFSVLEHVFSGAEHMSYLSQGNNQRARAEFEAALAIDRRDPPANTGMAWTYATDVMFGWSQSPQQDLERAEQHTRAAMQADPDYFYAHSVLGLVALLRGDHEAAIAHGEDALRLSGSAADAVAVHALVLSYSGQAERSLELAQRAIRLRPYTSPDWYQWILARAARLNASPRTALACLPGEESQEAGATATEVERALALADAGESAQARATMDATRRLAGPGFTAREYCSLPPYANAMLTQLCVGGLTRLGAPLG